MKKLRLIALILFIMSCGKKEQKVIIDTNLDERIESEEGTVGAVVNCTLDLIFQDNYGNDLLNPNTPNYIVYEDMKLFYLIKDEKVQISGSGMESFMNLTIIRRNPNIIRISTNTYEVDSIHVNGKSTTLLQIDEKTTDTIVSEWLFLRNGTTNINVDGGSAIINTKAWYNSNAMMLDTTNIIVKIR